MSSNIKNLKYIVELRLGMCFTMTEEEKVEYKIIDDKVGYPYNIKQQIVTAKDKQIPMIPKDTVHRVDTVLKSYDQIPCKINGNLTSILLDTNSDSNLLHGELLERVQNENARASYYTEGTLRKTQYLAYGFEFEDEDSNYIHQYSGYLTDFERNLECFQLTGSMFHQSIREINMHACEIEKLAVESRKRLQKTRK